MKEVRLKMLLSEPLGNGTNKIGVQEKFNGSVRLISIKDLDESGKLHSKNITYCDYDKGRLFLEYNDVLVSAVISGTGKSYIHLNQIEPLIFYKNFIRVRLNSDLILPKLFYYYTQSVNFQTDLQKYSTKTTFQFIPLDKISQFSIHVLDHEKQEQAVRFLDWKVGLIDRDIAATKKLIKNIKDLKISHISQIISGEKRLSKDTSPDFIFVNLRWLEKYPSDWDIIRLKFVSTYTTGNSISDFIKPLYADSTDARKYVATADIDKETLEIKHKSNIFIKHSDTSFKVAPKGSTLVCVEGGSGGKKVAFTEEDVSFVGKLCAIKPNKLLVNKYVYYLVLSNTFKNYYNYSINGDRNGVNLKNLGNFSFPLPPLEEQELIVKHLDSFVRIVKDFLQTSTAKLENLLKFRQSLITEVVTGQLDVSNITVPEYTKFDSSDLCADLDEEADLDSDSSQEAE